MGTQMFVSKHQYPKYTKWNTPTHKYKYNTKHIKHTNVFLLHPSSVQTEVNSIRVLGEPEETQDPILLKSRLRITLSQTQIVVANLWFCKILESWEWFARQGTIVFPDLCRLLWSRNLNQRGRYIDKPWVDNEYKHTCLTHNLWGKKQCKVLGS